MYMTQKDRTLSVRVTPQLASRLEEYADEEGMTVTDAHRHLLRSALQGQASWEEMKETKAIMDKLEQVEQEIKELDRVWWRDLFR